LKDLAITDKYTSSDLLDAFEAIPGYKEAQATLGLFRIHHHF
jgi:hypothetical protein